MDSHDRIMSRKHRIVEARAQQLEYNLAAVAGGRPYINLRLQRAPNESDRSWKGSDTDMIPGRKQRAYLLNDAGRIAGKINQYLFAQDAKRDGIDSSFAADTTTTGVEIQRFWADVSQLYTASGWVWLHADRGAPQIDPETGVPLARTVAQREAAGDRVYWSAWPAVSVPDWRFDESGALLWLLTEQNIYDNADPFAEASEQNVRTLWRRSEKAGGATWERYYQRGGKVEVVARGQISTPTVPFVPLGTPAAPPWWFDDVEMIQSALLNLASLHHENLVRTVYPQLVIPQMMSESLQARLVERYGLDHGQSVVETVRELIRGLDRPFIEDKENAGITRYLTPSTQDLKAIPEEEDRRRKALFDMVGLALFNRESRQVQTAESKRFDHLDTAATLRSRALLLEDVEKKLVELSARLDTSFSRYEPKWPDEFDVADTVAETGALVQLGNFTELTPTMRKAVLKAAVRLLDDIERITPEDREAIMEEIAALSDEAGDTSLFTPPGSG